MVAAESTRVAWVAGASGLVGSALMLELLAHPAYGQIVSWVRRASGQKHPRVDERVVDFAALPPARDRVDDVFIALGTTIKKAGSQEAFRRVDQDAVLAIARCGHAAGAKRAIVVSSVDAAVDSRNFYLRVKGEVEQSLATLGFSEVHLMRPSFLLGERGESRPGEKLGIFFAGLIAPILRGPWSPYHPIAARQVAAAMCAAAQVGKSGVFRYEYREMMALLGPGNERL